MRASLRWALSWRFYIRQPPTGLVWTWAAMPPTYVAVSLLMWGKVDWQYLASWTFALMVCLPIGTRRIGGYRRHSVSTAMKGLGRRTPATATTEGCSSYSQPGLPWGDGFVQTSHRLGNSYTARTSSIGATGTRGGSGGLQERAD